MKVINFMGGPGLGKSTTAAHIFYLMKKNNYKVELVPEYAKFLYYSEAPALQWNNQLDILNNQYKWLYYLNNKVDYAIVDSPLINSVIYKEDKLLGDLAISFFNSFDNVNFLLTREESYYSNDGRNQTLEEAINIDRKILLFLDTNNISYKKYDPCKQSPLFLLESIQGRG